MDIHYQIYKGKNKVFLTRSQREQEKKMKKKKMMKRRLAILSNEET